MSMGHREISWLSVAILMGGTSTVHCDTTTIFLSKIGSFSDRPVKLYHYPPPSRSRLFRTDFFAQRHARGGVGGISPRDALNGLLGVQVGFCGRGLPIFPNGSTGVAPAAFPLYSQKRSLA